MSISNRRVVLVLGGLLLAAWLESGDDAGADSTESSSHSAGSSAAARDPDLIGAWRHTDTYVSGDFTGVVDEYLWLNADGSYQEGGNAAAGNSGSSVVTGEGGGDHGAWMTEDRVLYLMPSGAGEWYAVASYVADGERMMFRLGGGSNKIWERM